MSRMIFVNLPVRDLDRAVGFWTGLGFAFNPQFTDEQSTCMVISDHACVMLLTEPFFSTFTRKPVAGPGQSETILALSAESREEVDRIVDAAVSTGGSAANDTQDGDYMYGRSFHDPDGHLWEVLSMDPAALEEQPV
jgi:predicted lactoylglutathione lyase